MFFARLSYHDRKLNREDFIDIWDEDEVSLVTRFYHVAMELIKDGRVPKENADREFALVSWGDENSDQYFGDDDWHEMVLCRHAGKDTDNYGHRTCGFCHEKNIPVRYCKHCWGEIYNISTK